MLHHHVSLSTCYTITYHFQHVTPSRITFNMLHHHVSLSTRYTITNHFQHVTALTCHFQHVTARYCSFDNDVGITAFTCHFQPPVHSLAGLVAERKMDGSLDGWIFLKRSLCCIILPLFHAPRTLVRHCAVFFF